VLLFARIPVRLAVDRQVATKLLRFGVPLAASLGVEAVVMNVQFMIVGATSGAAALGYFLLAFNISLWAQSVLGTAIRYVSVAGFSRLSEHDDEALSVGVQRSMPMLVTVVAPIAALTAVLAVPLVTLMYGALWAPAAPVLRFLMVLTFVRMVTALVTDALMGAGATRATLWVYLGWATALIPTLWFATRVDGIQGAAIAHAGVGLLVAIPLAVLALRRARVDLVPIGPALVRPLLATVVAGAVAVLVVRLVGPHAVVQLLAAGGAGVLTYVPIAVPRDQLRRLLVAVRGGGSSDADVAPSDRAEPAGAQPAVSPNER
jgi:PST family polysaccharide transporter